MRIAHLIMAHDNPKQLERFVKRLNHERFDIYIHLDKKKDLNDFKYISQLDQVFFIKNRISCNWGGFTFVKAITQSMREILLKKEYEYINLLSGQDYPIKPMNLFYDFLNANIGRSYLSYGDDTDSEWWKHAVSRYELYHLTDIRIRGRYLLQKILNKGLRKRKFPLPYDLFGGSCASWWTLHCSCAEFVVTFLEGRPELTRFMKFTWGADEFLFPTIIMNSPFRQSIVNRNFRFIKRFADEGHSRVCDVSDIISIKRSDSYFARKFDINSDSDVLDILDDIIDSYSDIPIKGYCEIHASVLDLSKN